MNSTHRPQPRLRSDEASNTPSRLFGNLTPRQFEIAKLRHAFFLAADTLMFNLHSFCYCEFAAIVSVRTNAQLIQCDLVVAL